MIAAGVWSNILSQTPGLDTAIGAGVAAVALCIAVACADRLT
ncbi:hypothetical protein [Streptomyces sp. enrichment culture]